MHSKPVTDYPKSVTVKLFGNPWELGDTVFDKRARGMPQLDEFPAIRRVENGT
jgi:hypothetical protein